MEGKGKKEAQSNIITLRNDANNKQMKGVEGDESHCEKSATQAKKDVPSGR